MASNKDPRGIPPHMRQPAIANLTVSVGTADGTVADVGAAFSQATLNNNFRDVSDKLNAVLNALRDAGLISN